ncbi:MAG TPA: methyltransferase domain-containing protein, partial [Burkholderiaceae bacterium]|nr:methyltransferase domain-containing protein [Burkholderiaceae bacterium]
QARIDRAVYDIFGYHALQMGLPELDGLRANRMPHRWRASDGLAAVEPIALEPEDDPEFRPRASAVSIGLRCDAEALPFKDSSIDLVVMPHTLELAGDAHVALSEATRVLVPGGRLVIVGFNPASLWGLRQRLGRTRVGLGLGESRLFLPDAGEFIGYWRLRDWLKLLSFDIEAGRFGCYRPPWNTEKWLARWSWMEAAGDRWWPVLGAVYFLVAVRRVHGVRLVGRVRKQRVNRGARATVIAQRRP